MSARRNSRSQGGSGIYRVTPSKKLQLVLVFLLAQVIFFYSDCFKLHTVSVRGNEQLKASYIVAQSGIPSESHPHFTEVSLPAATRNIESLLWVQSAKLQYGFPGRLNITVRERQPVLLVGQDDGRPNLAGGAWKSLSWFEVDGTGLTLRPCESVAHRGLPRLLVDDSLRVGGKLRPGLVAKVLHWSEILKAASARPISYYQMDSMGQVSFIESLVHKPTLIRIGAQEKDFNPEILRMLCERIEREGRPVEYVDLRFAYPAIRYPAAPPKSVSQVGRVQPAHAGTDGTGTLAPGKSVTKANATGHAGGDTH